MATIIKRRTIPLIKRIINPDLVLYHFRLYRHYLTAPERGGRREKRERDELFRCDSDLMLIFDRQFDNKLRTFAGFGNALQFAFVFFYNNLVAN